MQKLIECVPNISEGRDRKLIDEVVSAAAATGGVTVLDVDPGADTNRTVITFTGEPEPVLDAAFALVRAAMERIDMSGHKGAHPRMGATDVCPLIPVSGISLAECAELARRLGRRIGEELGLPIYFYGEAALSSGRRRLPDIREGEYEALAEKMKSPDFAPDAGPAVFLPKSGATAVGARDFLLAYNVNLNTKDVSLARDIALSVRESGRAKRDKYGEIIRHPDGTAVKVPGLLKHCQAAGWYIDEYGYAQVTMNLTNYHETGLHDGFDTVASEAERRGLRVTGSEVVGLLPKKAVLDAGIHYLKRAGLNTGIPEQEIIHTAVRSLGLNDTAPFDPSEKIVEAAVSAGEGDLAGLSCRGFADMLSGSSMAPGGGSVAALAAALSAGLTSMVANLSHANRQLHRRRQLMTEISVEAQRIKDRALDLVDLDTDAFNTYIVAVRMPKKTDEDIKKRDEALDAAAKNMTEVPLETLRLAEESAKLAEEVLKKGLQTAASDAGTAVAQAEAAALGAWMNVMINLQSINDTTYVQTRSAEADRLLESVRRVCRRGKISAVKRCRGEI